MEDSTLSNRFYVPGPLGHHLIYTKLNRGGMAEVFLARSMREPMPWVAFKTLRPKLAGHRRYVDMFLSEGKLGRMLQHPNIVSTLDVGQIALPSGPLHFLTMEYIHGRDLGAVARHFVRNGNRMPIGQALYIITHVLQGLSYAHDLCDASGMPLHLVNRDVSPPNVMVGFDGTIKLIDFGIAQATLDYKSQIGSIKGKLSYMSPEQIRGLPVDRRSDLFSVAVMLYQLVTGVEPFAGESEFEQMERVRRAEVQPASTFNRHVSERLDAFLQKGMARDVAARYQHGEDMLDDLRTIREELSAPYRTEDMRDFMYSVFQDDLDVLKQRILTAMRHARGLGKHPKVVWTPQWSPEQGGITFEEVQKIFERDANLPGITFSDEELQNSDTLLSIELKALSRDTVHSGPQPSLERPTTQPPQADASKEPAPTSPGSPPWVRPVLIALGVLIVALLGILIAKKMA